MNREFLLNLVFLLAVNLLIKPFYLFGIDRTVQNVVAPGAYGLYFALFNFTFVLQIINDAGIQHFNNRNIAQYRQLLTKYFPNILILKGILAALFLVVVFFLARLWGYEADYYPILFLLAANQILSSLIFFLRSNISGLGLYRTDSLLSVFDRLLLIGIVGLLLILPGGRASFQIEWFVRAQTAALGLTALLAFLLVRRRTSALRFRWRPRFWGLILRQSYPYALVIFLMGIYTRIDGVMIERLLPNGAMEADLYASAYRLLDASNTLGLLFAGLLFPMFARLIKEGQPVAPLVRLSLRLLWGAAVSLATATIVFRVDIMTALYANGGPYSGTILAWLMASFLAVSGSYVYGTLLGAQGALRAMNVIALCGVALNIGLNLVFIPSHGAQGAAAATCATQFLVFFAQIIAAQRRQLLVFAPRLAAQLTGFLVMTALLNFLGHQYAAHHTAGAGWLIGYIAGIGGGLALAFLFRLVDWRELTATIQGSGDKI